MRPGPNLLRLRFPDSMDDAERLLTFIGRERQCCPFLTFEMIFKPEERGLWLMLGGDNAVVAHIQDQLEAHWACIPFRSGNSAKMSRVVGGRTPRLTEK